jgi:hypothetical protein
LPTEPAWRVDGNTPGNSYEQIDNLAIGASDDVCVATLINGCISVISPAGLLNTFVSMPDRYTTNICFGGEALRTAYVTLSQCRVGWSAWTGRAPAWSSGASTAEGHYPPLQAPPPGGRGARWRGPGWA